MSWICEKEGKRETMLPFFFFFFLGNARKHFIVSVSRSLLPSLIAPRISKLRKSRFTQDRIDWFRERFLICKEKFPKIKTHSGTRGFVSRGRGKMRGKNDKKILSYIYIYTYM
jgi:hypothetical protein